MKKRERERNGTANSHMKRERAVGGRKVSHRIFSAALGERVESTLRVSHVIPSPSILLLLSGLDKVCFQMDYSCRDFEIYLHIKRVCEEESFSS